MDILKKRRPYLYSGKIRNVVGIDIKFNKPKKTDMVIQNSKDLKNLELSANKIIKKLKIK